jgi:hypothetical protein
MSAVETIGTVFLCNRQHGRPVFDEVGGAKYGGRYSQSPQRSFAGVHRLDDAGAAGMLRPDRRQKHDVWNRSSLRGACNRLQQRGALRNEARRAQVGRRQEIESGRARERLFEPPAIGQIELDDFGAPRGQLTRLARAAHQSAHRFARVE